MERENRPRNGEVHEAMVKRRNRFHHAVRRIKRLKKEMKSKKLLDAEMA